jgi:starch synthase (maltosyl-transferring)
MYRLAKLGFTQSYTYFPWRNTAWEIRQYHSHLTKTEVREYFRLNSWPNTPDILTEYLQTGGCPAFRARLVLAATLTASYGIYGPAFEACEQRPRHPGSEEYLDSEKYQIRQWHLEGRRESLAEFLKLMNRIRKENPALHSDWSLTFHDTDNPQLVCYSKCTQDLSNIIIVVVNVDPHHVQSGRMEIVPRQLGLDEHDPYQAHDLISGARYLFHGFRNYVSIDPAQNSGSRLPRTQEGYVPKLTSSTSYNRCPEHRRKRYRGRSGSLVVQGRDHLRVTRPGFL